MASEVLLEVEDLKVEFPTDDGVVHAVDELSYTLRRGETLGIVGESGSGKSVSSLAVMGLLRESRATITGAVRFKGRDMLAMDPQQLRQLMGNELAMIFQDPFSSLHPMHRIGSQLIEAVRVHEAVNKATARQRAVQLLGEVGIPGPEELMKSYPHEFSGGMRQRVMIAMALINKPDVLIADEPTTALDVTVQAQILELIDRARKDFDIGVLLVTHDLDVVAEASDSVMVMYAGRVMEMGTTSEVFTRPRHPYTWGLFESIPRVRQLSSHLQSISGSPPSLVHLPTGCPFHPRCPHAFPACSTERPLLEPENPSHKQACHLESREKDTLWQAREQRLMDGLPS